jgi:photosystem II stability/assembly factor-like uncharacterized protein
MRMSVHGLVAGAACLAALAAMCLASPRAEAATPPGYFGVDFINDSTGWVVGSDATILRTADGGTTWQVQSSKAGGATLSDVCILPDGKTGWAVGTAGTVMRTTDGKTWTTVITAALDRTFDLTSVKFLDARTGWIAGGVAAGPMQGTPRGAVYRSTDGGLTWSAPVAAYTGWCPIALDPVSTTSAACAGIQRVVAGAYNAPAVVWTADGKSWGSAPTLLRPAVKQTSEVGDLMLSATGNKTGAVVVGDYSELLPGTPFAFSSANVGAAFGYVSAAGGPRQLRGVSLPTAKVGYAVGSGATAVLKTGDGGASWTAVATPLGKNLFAVDFISATTGYAVGRTAAGTAPMVIRTTSSASSWTAVK